MYKEFKYIYLGKGSWNLTYPSGYTGVIKADTEVKVKEMIDYIIANLKDPKANG
jgi:hypothetical protein